MPANSTLGNFIGSPCRENSLKLTIGFSWIEYACIFSFIDKRGMENEISAGPGDFYDTCSV